MKLFYFLLLVAPYMTSSCHKSNSASASASAVTGNWLWVRSDWTAGPSRGTDYPATDTAVELELQPGGKFAVYLNGQLQIDSSFRMQIGSDSIIIFSGQCTAELNLSGRYFYSTLQDTLTLSNAGPYSPSGDVAKLYFIPYQSSSVDSASH